MRRPRVRNAISRKRESSVVASKTDSSKISASARNEIVVPVPVASPICFHRPLRHAAREALAVRLAVGASTVATQPLGERVHDREADAVQAAGDLVALAAELAAGVQLRQHDLERGGAGALDLVDRDAAAAVDDRDRVVRVDRDVDGVVVARERLVDGVVDDLVDEVVEAPDPGRADVHARAQPDRLETFEHRDVLGRVTGLRLSLRHTEGNACKTRVLPGT